MAQSTTPRTVLVGLGETGLSVARHLHRRGEAFAVCDESPSRESVAALRAEWPDVSLHEGNLDAAVLQEAAQVIVSPGVPFDHPALQAANTAGAQVCGDIELFAHVAEAPILGITGSNGKSTATLLVSHLLESLGVCVRSGGNLGPPALSLIKDDAPDVYVLELSSFQLEATHVLPVRAGVVLNVTPDHLDRHGSLEQYQEIKLRMFRDAEIAIYNRGDRQTQPAACGVSVSFGLDTPPSDADFGICTHRSAPWFFQGATPLAPCADLQLVGDHNRGNVLAALAMVAAYGADVQAAAAHLATFTGLEHRLCPVATIDGVTWFDDSKATNFDAMIAALAAFDDPCVLIAGGQSKKDTPQRVADIVEHRTQALIVYGEAADELAEAWSRANPIVTETLAEAVAQARGIARSGDRVLLSPGCASFDQYENYQERGVDFLRAIKGGAS